MMIDAKDIIKRDKILSGLNSSWREYFQDLADFGSPRKAYMNTARIKGSQLKFNFLYDSTAIRSLKVMAAGFHSNLTNPSTRWFGLQTRDLRYMDYKENQVWFKDVDDIIFSVLNGSNFDTTMQEFYTDCGLFGTGGILTLEDSRTKVRFSLAPIGKVNLEEDAEGRISAVYLSFKLTAEQAYMKWGDKAGENIVSSYKDKPTAEFDFLHYVGPRNIRDANKEDTLNMPYASVWVNVKESKTISESGFFENPYAIGRFYKDPIEVFGFSPAMDVLADIKLVNAMQKTMLRAAMKQADPPMQAPSKGYMLPLNFNPSAMNYRDAKTTADSLAPINVGGGSLPITLEIIQSVQENIEKGFFVNVFRAISDITKQMNNPEVERIIAESMVQLGPVVGRFTSEVLSPTILRVFNILYRNGELPEPPAMLQGQELDVIYLSQLARVQRESEMYGIGSFLQTIGGIATVKPAVLDKLDEDACVDIISRIKGINPQMIRDKKEVDEIRKLRSEAQAAQAKLLAGQQIADVVKTGAEAGKTMQEANAV
jgi:hypothetical protein